MKQSVIISLLLLVLISGCTVSPAPESATSTPAPSSMPEPTLTPLPTDTPTSVPTSTPDKTATAAVQATETSDSILKEMDRVLGDSDIPYKQGHLAWKHEKPMRVNLSGPSKDYMGIDDSVVAENFILKSDVTWEATGIIVCGFMFRSEPNFEDGKQYQFAYLRLSGLPAWQISVYEFGRYKNSPSGTKFSGAIDQGNRAMNQILLVAQDEQFTVYINKARQGRYFDYSKQRTEGFFAFHGYQESGKGNCNFENSWLWVLE